jgi:hypothetical protein
MGYIFQICFFFSFKFYSPLVYVGQARTNFYKLAAFLNVRNNVVIIVISRLRHALIVKFSAFQTVLRISKPYD